MKLTNEVFMYVVFFVVCVLGIQGKPSLSFNFPSWSAFGNNRDQRAALKSYSGKRVRDDSIRMVYYYDQTIAVAELGPKKLLLSCELLEVYGPDDAVRALGELRASTRPVQISFQEMLKLMDQCQQLEEGPSVEIEEAAKNHTGKHVEGRGILSNSPFTLLSGIIPGTKWCGTGDIALDYHDLGTESEVDKCCRAHDLCPVKVRAYSNRYNLTNQSLYTKSHCKCDDYLFDCLKSDRNLKSQTANIMGNIYFNLVQVPCLEDTRFGRKYRGAKSSF